VSSISWGIAVVIVVFDLKIIGSDLCMLNALKNFTREDKKEEGANIPFLEANNYIMFLLKNDTVQYLTKYNPNPVGSFIYS
jgi:hypothetical protein